MKITNEWLQEKEACENGLEWFDQCGETDSLKILKLLISDGKLDWANWLIVRVMTRSEYLAYAIFAAEQVIDLFENKFPNDDRPRKAIQAAKAVLKNDNPAAWAAAGDAARASRGRRQGRRGRRQGRQGRR